MTDEEKKKLYIYVLIAALLGGGGSTGMQMLTSTVRNDPATGTELDALRQYVDILDAQTANRDKKLADNIKSTSARVGKVWDHIYTKEQIREKTDINRVLIKDNGEDIDSIRADIRNITSLIAKLPPPPLLQRVTILETELKQLKKAKP